MQKHAYREIAAYFLKLGVLGFGGPLALMSAFQKDLVEDRKWLTPERFAQALALVKALPGPVATQLAIYLGMRRGGRIGGIIAGTCLIIPAFVMMVMLGAFYDSFESMRWTRVMLFGMQSAALGVIIESVWRLCAPYRRDRAFWVVALVAAVATSLKPSLEPLIIIGSGLFGAATVRVIRPRATSMFLALAPVSGFVFSASPDKLDNLALVMLKAGALVFGTGLAIVPMLAHDVVDVHSWMTQQQFLDALAFGQITPGPVVITSTFIGYEVAGLVGAAVATFAMFLPAFVNILTWFSFAEERIGASDRTRKFVMWAIAAVVGSIAVSLYRLVEPPPLIGNHFLVVAIAAGAMALTLKAKLPVWLVIPGLGLLIALVNGLL